MADITDITDITDDHDKDTDNGLDSHTSDADSTQTDSSSSVEEIDEVEEIEETDEAFRICKGLFIRLKPSEFTQNKEYSDYYLWGKGLWEGELNEDKEPLVNGEVPTWFTKED